MELALRVLEDVSQRRQPDAYDVERLRLVAPEHDYLPADELACEVIRGLLGRDGNPPRAAGG